MAEERTALLIIRAWVEPSASSPLRVNIRYTTNIADGFQQSLNVTDVDAVMRAVRLWLDDVAEREQPLLA